MNGTSNPLVYDILLLVLELLCDDYKTLSRCSLVNWEFNRVSSKVLYVRAVLSPPFRPSINLRDKDGLSEHSIFMSSSLARNAQHVLFLEISGFLSPRPPPLNPLPGIILSAIQTFKNLHTATLLPKTFPEDLFTEVLKTLKACSSLRKLNVNSSCTDYVRAPILAEIEGLETLTLYDPTRAILQLLPDWLDRLSKSLNQLHLKDNCGSITPGVLRSFIPHLQSIHSFTLGLSYSLTDDDLFSFLGQLPQLDTIQLRYYLQLKSPLRMPALVGLRSFTVKHSHVQTRQEVNRLCKWIRRAISSSPLEHLRIICDDAEDYLTSGPNVGFDSLIDHLGKKHSDTLRSLHLGSAYISVDAFKYLCQTCLNLEEFNVTAGKNSLMVFAEYALNMGKLHTASFNLRNIKRSKALIDDCMASEIVLNGPPLLRRLAVNGVVWEGSWVSEDGLEVVFVVRKLPTVKSHY